MGLGTVSQLWPVGAECSRQAPSQARFSSSSFAEGRGMPRARPRARPCFRPVSLQLILPVSASEGVTGDAQVSIPCFATLTSLKVLLK